MTALPLIAAVISSATVQLTAERLVHDDARKVTTAEGTAELLAANAALSADRITWDEAAGAATASGNVALRLAKNGLLAVVADVVTVRMTGDDVSEVYVYDGVALRKKNTTAAALFAAKTPDQVRATGTTTMSMTATHLTRTDDDTWVIDDLGFTPCECDFDKPSWHIGTSRTTLDLEKDRASLLFPTVYVWKIPVLWFPWLSLPLSDRQTGLLVPRPGFTNLNGFSLEQPVFVTLGRSADLTFTPGYYFGNRGLVSGIEGPRLLTELRYTPSAKTSGRATFGLIYDRKLRRDPESADPTKTLAQRRGIRAEGSWQHLQELGKGFHDRVNASFLSDGDLQRDITPDILAREANYLRSTATLFHRGDDHFAGLDVTLRQDLTTPDTIFSRREAAPNPVQRLPGLTIAFPSRRIVGPLTVGGRAEYARLAPAVIRASGLEGYDRIDLMPRLDVGGVVAQALSLSAFAAWRQDVWFGERSGNVAHRGYPLLGGTVQTELARTFNESVRHTIAPSIELRAVPFVIGTPTPPWRYDEIDAAITGPAVQAVALVRQRLQVKGRGDVVRLDVGQSFNLLPPVTTGESFARLGIATGLFRATGTVRVDPLLKIVTRVSVLGSLDDGRGRGAYLSFEQLTDTGTDRARQPIDLLIGPRLVPNSASQVVTFGGRWRVGGLGLRYDAIFLDLPRFKWPSQQTVGVSYGPACECWRLEVFGTYRPDNFPDLGASLTITGFGTLGTGG